MARVSPGLPPLLTLACLLALACPLAAGSAAWSQATALPDQRVNLAGQVLERSTQAPIGGAMVKLALVAPDTASLTMSWSAYLGQLGRLEGQYADEEGLVTYTDSTGTFRFRALPPGQVSVTFPNAGYAPFEATETIRPDELVQLTVRLRRRQYDAQEVVVYGRRPELETSRQSLARHEVERLPGTGGDVIRSVQALPGVARRRCPTRAPSSCAAAATSIRGSCSTASTSPCCSTSGA
jgi:hypothetical protein